MISAAAILMLSSMLYSLRLSSGSFPKPLSAKEEQEYLEKAAAGDLEARNILIERNLRLVAHIMKKYYAQTSDQEDLISIGTIGLIKAVSTFDAGKGIRLATYAARCVENEILMHFRSQRKSASDVSLSDYIETGMTAPLCPSWMWSVRMTTCSTGSAAGRTCDCSGSTWGRSWTTGSRRY